MFSANAALMTKSVQGDLPFSVVSGSVENFCVTRAPKFTRFSIGVSGDLTSSAIYLVESDSSEAVLDVRHDGVMRFASNGDWFLWVCQGPDIREYKPDGVELYEDIVGNSAVVVNRHFSVDTAWIAALSSDDLEDAPAVWIRVK